MELELTNFRHHRSKLFQLPAKGVVLFSGASGSGKSTVLNAIEWLLYGKLTKVASFDQKKTAVKLTYRGQALSNLRDDRGQVPDEIVITRKKDPNLLQLSCAGQLYEDAAAQGLINKLFGSESMFSVSSYLKQGDRNLLLDGRNSDKMQVVEQFAFHEENISEFKAVITKALAEADKSISLAKGGHELLLTQIEQFRVLHAAKLRLLTDFGSVEQLQADLEQLEAELTRLTEEKQRLELADAVRSNALKINGELKSQLAELQRKVQPVTPVTPGRVEELQTELSQLREELEQLNERKRTLHHAVEQRMNALAANQLLEQRIAELRAQLTDSEPEVDQLELEQLEQQLQHAQLGHEYQSLRSEHQRLQALFITEHGNDRPEQVTAPDPQREYQIVTELADLKRVAHNYDLDYRKNEEVQRQLNELAPVSETEAELQAELETVRLQAELMHLADYQPVNIEAHGYPQDEQQLAELLALVNDWRAKLSQVKTELTAVTCADTTELERRITEVKLKLDNCGCKLTCPNCNVELLYNNERLKLLAPKKERALPCRAGTKPIVTPVVTLAPAETEICTENRDDLIKRLTELERVQRLVQELSPPTGLDLSDTAVTRMQALLQQLRTAASVAPMLALKDRLTVELAGRCTDRTRSELLELLELRRQRDKLQAELTELVEPDSVRWAALEEEYSHLTVQRAHYERVRFFTLNDELLVQRRTQRFKLLCKLFNTEDELELSRLDEEEHTWPVIAVLTAKVAACKQQLQRQTERLQIKFKLDTLNAELREVPADVSAELAEVIEQLQPLQQQLTALTAELKTTQAAIEEMRQQAELQSRIQLLQNSLQPLGVDVTSELNDTRQQLVAVRERQHSLKELQISYDLQLDLQTRERDAEERQQLIADRQKQYALLDKLRLKSLEAESIALQTAVANINHQLAEQLNELFTDPITVRLETTRELRDGRQKHCINLSVNYRGVEYDDIKQLSGGEVARISIALTIALNKACNAPLLFLDESLSALDADLVDHVIDSLKLVAESYQLPIFVVLHNSVQGLFDDVIEFTE